MGIQIIGSLTRRKLSERTQPIVADVVHTTGDTDLDKILRFYLRSDGLQPHYVIAVGGTIYRTAWEEQVAYHCKIEPAEARLYQLGYEEWSNWVWRSERPQRVDAPFPGYAQWRATWPGLRSPLDLITGEHPNSRSIGIELQQPVKPGPDIFTDDQYASLRALLADIHSRRGGTLDRQHVLGHYDCSPMRRSTSAGGWDPGVKFNWTRAIP